MKVKKLIEILQECDPNATVLTVNHCADEGTYYGEPSDVSEYEKGSRKREGWDSVFWKGSVDSDLIDR
jgi:V8-like Glu-specific endopeptidase